MKKYKIIMLPSAKRDLENMVDYLSLFYPSAAMKKYDKIIKTISLLQEQPQMCEIYPCDVSDLQFRKMVVDEYLVFYTVIKDTVEIHAIINGKTDYAKNLFT